MKKSPLLVREGARFDCVGDGLCCTDIHAIGALSEQDCEMIGMISDDAIFEEKDGAKILLMQADTGGCVFLQDTGCAIHAALGPDAKPSPCLRYPFGLTATPHGGRITTQHRCPCRTLGDRPALTADDAVSSLLGESDEPGADHAVDETIAWSASETLRFDEYAERESELLKRALAGERLVQLLGADPFPPLKGTTWGEVSDEMRTLEGSSRLEGAIQWAGDAMASLLSRTERPARGRPWATAFDKAVARGGSAQSPGGIFADWIADEIWSLHWTDWGPFERARAELVTRLMVARHLAAWLIEDGQPDHAAAAEAVAIVEIVSHSDWWDDVKRAL